MSKNAVKNIVMVVAIILCLALAGGWIAQTVIMKQKEKELSPYMTVDETAAGMQLDLPTANSGISFQSDLIAVEDYDEYGISAQAETAYTLNATVTPENAPDKSLTWSLKFANPSSSWANGKTPSSYVTLNTSGTQATISCKAAFGEPILVTATANADSTKTATCRLNYKQKVSNVVVTLGTMEFYPMYGSFFYLNGMKLGECRIYPTFIEYSPAEYDIELTSSTVYTVPANDLSVRVVVSPTDALITALENKGYTPDLPEFVIEATGSKTGELDNYFDKGWAESIVGGTLTASAKNQLVTDMRSMDIIAAYNVNFYADGNTLLYSYGIHLDFWDVQTEGGGVSGVSFDKTELEF